MRRAVVACAVAVVLAGLLLLPGSGWNTPGAVAGNSAAKIVLGLPAPPAAPAPRALPQPSQTQLRDAFSHNLTSPAFPRPAAGRVPDSARFASPPPRVPGTIPTVLNFLTYSTGCCVEENFSVPAGTWESVILNYTGLAAGSVYDSSYRAYLDGTLVLFGTTPEYGTWTVLQNLTAYSSLLHGTANLTFLLGAAPSPGYFRTNVSMAFYPVPAGGTPPSAPDAIVPLWEFKSVTSSAQSVYTNATVPTNVSRAVLQLYAFPFMDDEFFWGGTSAPNPTGLRVVEFGLNSSPLAAMLPFPFFQTGGIDFFLWRPIPAVFTLNMPPLELNVTGALGSLEGSHEYWAKVLGVDQGTTSPSGAKWLVEGSLLLWTNTSVTAATPQAASFSGPTTSTTGGVQQSTVDFAWTSQFHAGARIWDVTSTTHYAFADALGQPFTGSWKNFTESTSMSEQTQVAGNLSESRTYGFGITTDWGPIQFHETSSTMGGYPILGNFTEELLNTNQRWDATVTGWGPTAAGTAILSQHLVDEQLVDASGIYGGEMEVQSATSGAVIIAFNASTSATTEQYTQMDGSPTAPSVYAHLLAGSALDPAMPYVAEDVVTDASQSTPFPLLVTLGEAGVAVDVGHPAELSASASGGVPPYVYGWTGLPAGCSSTNTSLLGCTPTSTGTFPVDVTVRDATGAARTSAAGTLLVVPGVRAQALTTTPGVDVGGNASYLPVVSGGVPPVACSWTVGTTTTLASCTASFGVPATTVGPLAAVLTATDAAGIVSRAPAINVTVAAALTVAAFLFPSSGNTPAGTAVSVVAQTTGGTGPFVFNWTLNGTPIVGAGGWNVTFVPSAPGTYTLAVQVSDAAGSSAGSNTLTLTVTSAVPRSGSGSTSSAAPATPEWAVLGLVAVVVIEAGAIAVLVAGRRPPPGPPRPRAPVRSRPPP